MVFFVLMYLGILIDKELREKSQEGCIIIVVYFFDLKSVNFGNFFIGVGLNIFLGYNCFFF